MRGPLSVHPPGSAPTAVDACRLLVLRRGVVPQRLRSSSRDYTSFVMITVVPSAMSNSTESMISRMM